MHVGRRWLPAAALAALRSSFLSPHTNPSTSGYEMPVDRAARLVPDSRPETSLARPSGLIDS